MCLPKLYVTDGNNAVFGQFRTEVTRARICDDLALVVECLKSLPNEVVETKLIRPSNFNEAIQRGTRRHFTDRTNNIVRGDRLKQYGWKANCILYGGLVGNTFDE